MNETIPANCTCEVTTDEIVHYGSPEPLRRDTYISAPDEWCPAHNPQEPCDRFDDEGYYVGTVSQAGQAPIGDALANEYNGQLFLRTMREARI